MISPCRRLHYIHISAIVDIWITNLSSSRWARLPKPRASTPSAFWCVTNPKAFAKALDVPQNTMSVHLATLARAGLVTSERRSRIINYRADLDALRSVMLFLVKDCCGGRAELCHPLADELLACRAA